MSFRILLIKPNICVRKGFDLQSKLCPPIGLAYLAGMLLKNGFDVGIIDMVADGHGKSWDYRNTHNCFGMTDNELLQKIKQFGPDLIGITGFTTQHSRIVEITSSIKNAFPKSKIVLGGIHSTSTPDYLMTVSEADYIILGEGEHACVALADALKRKDEKAIELIDGIVFRSNGEVVRMKKTNFIKNLDELPLPPVHLFNNEVYLRDEVAMPIISSRGCPNNCTFCAIHNTQGYGWRSRSPMKVVDEIEILNKTYGYKTISFFDDAFNVDAERVIMICQEIVNRNIKVRLVVPGGLIVKRLTSDVLSWLKKAGCTAVSLPFEHADENMRNKIIRKGLKGNLFEDVLQWCREFDLLALVNFVIGMPGETEESLKVIKEYVRNNAFKMDAVQVLIATPFPGTAFYEDCIKNNYIANPEKNDFLDFDLYGCLIDTPTLRQERVDEYKKIIENSFSEARGGHFDETFMRRAIRKPTKETEEYIKNTYFRARNRLWDKHSR